MNRAYDYNGVVVAESRPKKILTRVKKTIHIDSGDRDQVKYYTNGDFVVYLPRTYQQVVSIRLKDAQFPPLTSDRLITLATSSTTIVGGISTPGLIKLTCNSTTGLYAGMIVTLSGITLTAGTYTNSSDINGTWVLQNVGATSITVRTTVTTTAADATFGAGIVRAWTSYVPGTGTQGALTHLISNGPNNPLSIYSGDNPVSVPTPYFLIGLEGLNKTDETTVGANRSTYSDSFFAKIPATTTTYGPTSASFSFINYNDHSALENIATYSPPVENLDRLRITVRTHAQQDKSGFLYWTSNGDVAGKDNRTSEFNLTLEVEYLENTFDDFSTYETRLSDR
jgi:hypothetical protein